MLNVLEAKMQSICFSCIWMVLGGLITLTPSGLAQKEITLRFVDAASGKPITGISVAIFVRDKNEGQQKARPPGVPKLDKNSWVVKTDKKGHALFALHYKPELKTLYIDSVGELRGCSANRFSLAEVLRTGVVASYHAGKLKWCVPLKAHANAKPGEVVIFDKRLTVWDRIRQEIP